LSILAYGTPVMLSNKSRCHSAIIIKLGLGTFFLIGRALKKAGRE
jgi:hypothetical protein